MRDLSPGLFKQFLYQPVKDQIRRARSARGDFDILPGYAAAPAGLQSFERRFFCGKASRIMLRGDGAATVAIGAFGCGKNALDKTRRARQHFANARNFDNVYADGNDHSS